MLVGLASFGVPGKMLNAISAIYSRRRFRMRDCNETSNWHEPKSGISQGCPLSTFLFCMIMTVIMEDASRLLKPADRKMTEG